jgi:hypothetical protein
MLKHFYLKFVRISLASFLSINSATAADLETNSLEQRPPSPMTNIFLELDRQSNKRMARQAMRTLAGLQLTLSDERRKKPGENGFNLREKEELRLALTFVESEQKFFENRVEEPTVQEHIDYLKAIEKDLTTRIQAGDFDPKPEEQQAAATQEQQAAE